MDTLEELRKQRAELDMKIELLEYVESTFQEGEVFWFVDAYGNIQQVRWDKSTWIDRCFDQGHIFNTEQEARLEAQRRNLLQRFKMFRDKCNGDWKADFKNKTAKNEAKWNISYYNGKLQAACTNTFNDFVVFGYFKKKRGALRAIKLFGNEIIELYVEGE